MDSPTVKTVDDLNDRLRKEKQITRDLREQNSSQEHEIARLKQQLAEAQLSRINISANTGRPEPKVLVLAILPNFQFSFT